MKNNLKALEKAQEKMRKMRENGETIVTLNPWQKWQEKDTRCSAINAHCWHCHGGTADYVTDVREGIRNCTAGPDSSQPCPLYHWRPFKKSKKGNRADAAEETYQQKDWEDQMIQDQGLPTED